MKKDYIPEILAGGVPLLEYAHSRGYTEINKTKSSRNSKIVKNPTNGDKILITISGMKQTYKNLTPGMSHDWGNVINFTINRLNNGLIQANQSPAKGSFNRALEILKGELGNVAFVNAPKHDEYKSVKNDKDRIKNSIKNLIPLTPAAQFYLTDARKISNSVINSPNFSGTIVTARSQMPSGAVIENCAFLKRDFETRKVEGYTAQWNRKKDGTNPKRVIALNPIPWTSNILPSSNNLFIGESEIDCLSHYQLNKPEKAVYVSSGGQFTDESIKYILRVKDQLSKDKDIQVSLITDNDVAGFNYDLSYMIAQHNHENPISPIEISQSNTGTKLTHHTNVSIDDPQGLKQKIHETISEEMGSDRHGMYINIASLKGLNIIEFPTAKDDKLYKHLTHIMDYVNSQMSKKVNLVKSQKGDWNDELKESLKPNRDLQQRTNIDRKVQRKI